MKLGTDMARLLALALVLALLRHLSFGEVVLMDPAALVESLDGRAVVLELPADEVMPLIENRSYTPVDLRRDSPVPVIGSQIAWILPLPHSMTILARYRERATAKRLAFFVTPAEREEGLQMLRRICKELRVRDAILILKEV